MCVPVCHSLYVWGEWLADTKLTTLARLGYASKKLTLGREIREMAGLN